MNGLNTGFKPLLWSGAALLLMLLMYVPVLNFIALLLMMVPYVVLYATLNRTSFLLHLIPVWLIAGFMAGPGVLVIGLIFLPPAIVMGHLYRKGAPASRVLKLAGATMLGQFMLQLFVLQQFFDISLINGFRQAMNSMFDRMMEQGFAAVGWTSDHTEQFVSIAINMIPLAFMIFSFVYTVLSHYISRRVLIRGGMSLPAFPKAREWKLPRSLVFVYLLVYVMDMFMVGGSSSFFAVAIMNLAPLLSYVFAIQAIGFFFFLAHHRNWNGAIPLLLAVPVLLIPPLSLIGVMDTAFPIRKALTKQQ